MKKKPVNGMKDIMPNEMAIRNYVISLIRETYDGFGFSSIETPCMESIENLQSKQGGENEKLIFKIMKRGEKLKIEEAKNENDLCDAGLRYDLTLPLSRYYANNSGVLPSPFKAIQIGNVWRADRPQRGRFRQFTQCDIDILGDDSFIAEIELISATTTVLTKLDFKNFTIRINDRRILKAMAACCGFPESDFDKIFIIVDKMDKIGIDGVRAELIESGYSEESVDKYISFFGEGESVESIGAKIGDFLEKGCAENLSTIIEAVESSKSGEFNIKFDPTLVRGMSYYTGPIFEIAMDEFGGSVGGGGRYDNMIGRFTGNNVSACGFSIGFERIIMLLMERGFKVPGAEEKTMFLIDKKAGKETIKSVFAKAASLRAEGKTASVSLMKKNKKFQKEQLTENGYTEIIEIFE